MSSQDSRTPILILVSGAPASGKSHLARQLSKLLGIPAIHRDSLKETLFDALGVGDREWSKRLGAASWALLYDLVEGQLAAGRSIIAEANFYPDDRRRVQELEARHGARVVEVHCTAPPEVLRARYVERSRTNSRHAGHADDDALAAEMSRLAQRGVFGPRDVGNDMIVVDSTDFGQVDYVEIASKVRSLIVST